jgi:hypothetical protein
MPVPLRSIALVDSLGEGGVLKYPERYAPRPMTCHAKSSYFGFTRGLMPANPQFSRPDYIDTTGAKYQRALEDVNKTLGRGEGCTDLVTTGVGSAEGKALHLKVKINGEDCYIYQGTFKGTDDQTYCYQVAIPANTPTDEIQQKIQNKLQDQNYCKVCKDSNWQEEVKIFLGINWNLPQSEPTLVIRLTANSRGSQQTTERYYVSDCDVYAIAHVPPRIATLVKARTRDRQLSTSRYLTKLIEREVEPEEEDSRLNNCGKK